MNDFTNIRLNLIHLITRDKIEFLFFFCKE